MSPSPLSQMKPADERAPATTPTPAEYPIAAHSDVMRYRAMAGWPSGGTASATAVTQRASTATDAQTAGPRRVGQRRGASHSSICTVAAAAQAAQMR